MNQFLSNYNLLNMSQDERDNSISHITIRVRIHNLQVHWKWTSWTKWFHWQSIPDILNTDINFFNFSRKYLLFKEVLTSLHLLFRAGITQMQRKENQVRQIANLKWSFVVNLNAKMSQLSKCICWIQQC